MCGIQLQVFGNNPCTLCQQIQQDGINDDHNNLRRRGPDSCQTVVIDNPQNYKISLRASVLQMRQQFEEQPVAISCDEDQYFLCWNGEVYQTLDDELAGEYTTSDTRLVASLLETALRERGQPLTAELIASSLGQLYNSEFAFLVLSPTDVFFGRDRWGRRSLLQWNCPNNCGSFQIVSTTEASGLLGSNYGSEANIHWKEIFPGQVHQISLLRCTIQTSSLPIPRVSFGSPVLDQNLQSPPPSVSTEIWNASHDLEFHLSNAVAMRMDHSNQGKSPSGVLFSGGLDSAVVAALAAKHCQSELYLYNVSFGPSYEKSADRQAALLVHQEIQAKHPDKQIIFKDIVVDWEDICKYEPHIRTLLQPKSTLMDVNIATALWFASKGQAKESEKSAIHPRVLLLGMGADELLGGYGRHRKAFERGSWEELHSELVLDQDRLWERNLGRDDRIVADHGKEARFPFLDAHVTQFLQELPHNLICDFSLPPGQGDKRILRLVAMRLGICHASGLVKRAIQFGSRISHLSDAKRFGSRRRAKGEKTVPCQATQLALAEPNDDLL